MLALIVLLFIAIDVIILLVYDIYSATQGTLEAIRMRNRENIREVIGVKDVVNLNLKQDNYNSYYAASPYRCRR